MQQTTQRAMLLAPYYARTSRDDQRPQVHEYQHPDYMALFAEDLAKNRLQASRDQVWFSTNKLDSKPWPYLRQPIHQGYYIASSEIACNSKLRAAVAPERIKEAWVLVMPHGQASNLSGRTLRQTHMLLQNKLAQAQQAGMAFPARAQVVEGSKRRKHTIISGYLPLADIANKESKETLQTEQQISQSASDLGSKFADVGNVPSSDRILWEGDEPPRLSAKLANLVQLLDENLGLGVDDAKLVDAADVGGNKMANQAQISALSHWLDQVYFYQIPHNDRSNTLHERQQTLRSKRGRLIANTLMELFAAVPAVQNTAATLRSALQQTAIPAYTPRQLSFERIYDFSAERIAEFTNPWKSYVDALWPLAVELKSQIDSSVVLKAALISTQFYSALTEFIDAAQSCQSAAGALDQQFAVLALHRKDSLLEWYTHAREGQDLALQEQLPAEQRLIVPGSWVGQGPNLISQRWRSVVETYTADWQASQQASSLTQDEDQLYQIMLFATVRNDDGCEYLVHSSPGDPFYIASHYETRLMPTYPIKMPSLRDLKKAIRGPAMIMPSDLADKVNQLKFPDGKVEEGSGNASGMRWITVFSIPIVTICAMIMLMLMINILNFIFRWIPFAILRIPFPK